MTDQDGTSDFLQTQTRDYVASAARAALGTVPFAGSLLAEIAGVVIPNQRIDRIVKFARLLEGRLCSIEHQFVRSQLTNENFTDLVEEGLRQAAQSLSEERRQYIAELISRALTSTDISYVQSKHLLRLLGELNDIEIIRLAWHRYETYGSGQDYWETHKSVLEPVNATFGAEQTVLDQETLQASYDAHLSRLGLLEVHYRVDHRTKQPEFDSRTGAPEVRGHGLSSLGRLLLRQIGLPDIEQAG